MKKRLKGLVCWWLVLVMLVSTMVTPAMALPSNRIYIYAGTEPLKANDELYPYVREGVSEGTQLSSLVPLGDGVTLTGWNLWEFDNINSGYVITDKLLTKDTDWTLSADDVEIYATGDYYAFEPIYSGKIAIYTGTDEVAADKFVGDYEVVSAKTDKALSEQAEVMNVLNSSKTLEEWDIWSAGWSDYHSGTVWNERISEESADYTLSSKYFVTSDDPQYYLVPVYSAAPPHVCQWSYSIKADQTDTVVATCIGEGECTSTANKELAIIKPLHIKVNDGKNAAATLSATSIGAITELPDIVYYKYSQYPNIDESSATTTPFENVGGTYKAQITVGGVTAYTNYTVGRLEREDINSFTISDVTVNSFVITLDEADRSKTDFVCQFGGNIIEFTPDANGRATITVPDDHAGSNNLWVFVYQKQTDIYEKSNTKDTTVSLKNPEYTVIFNANGGSGTMANQTITLGEATALSENIFTKTGYTFEGWATTAAGTKVYNDKQSVSDLTNAGESITLFAVWNKIPANAPAITFQPQGFEGTNALTYGSIGADKKLSVETDADENEYIVTYQWYKNTTNSKDGAVAIGTEKDLAIENGLSAGDYYYYCKITVTRKDNGESTSVDTELVKVTVNKATVAVPTAASKVYTGSTLKADISETADYTVTTNNGGITVGQYDVVLNLKDSANYKWSDGTETAAKTIEFEITKSTTNVITGLAIEDWTYGESPKTPSASATFGTPAFTYVGTNYAENATPPANAGTYKVIAKVADTTNYEGASYEMTFTIAKATPSVSAPTAKAGLVYNGADKALVSAGTTSGGEMQYSLDGSTWATEIPQGNSAGSYTVYYKVVGGINYNDNEGGTVQVTIAKATPTVTAPVAKNNLVYNTSALVLTDAGSTTGGTMQYSLDNISWSNDIPSGTNAGDYTIYYRVVGNSNYNDVAAQSISVSIENADMLANITANGYNGVFDNQAHTISVAIPDGASIKYGTDDGTYELVAAPQYTNVGTYKVYYKVEKANYNAVTGSADVVITAKDISNAEITLGEALTYTGNELTRDFTVALLDGLVIDYTISGNTGINAGNYELTISGQYNFAGTKSVNWSISKASQPAPETPAAVNETIKAKADGKITGVNFDMEYKLEGPSEYIAISETEIANLAAGTYLVRYKENANHLAGADKQLIIADGAMITVSFNSNEGTAVDSITCEYNQAITAPAEPTKENFVFAGWYKDAGCFDLWNFGNALTEDITLYAKWNDKPVYSVSGKVTDGESGLGGITVTLKQGNTIIATATTAADGSYSFITEDGLYNIVAEKKENDNSTIKTVKIEVIESANVNDVVFVATDINSELEIKPYTPQIIVGGLDEEAKTVSSSYGDADVTVKMTVESKEDITGSDDATGQEQRQTEQKEIKKVSGNRYIQFIEINLTQSISGAESTKLEETSGLIEIIIPFEKGNKRNITVYRYHGSASKKLGAGIGNANADCEYFEVKENHIVVYAKKFSTYAIGYDLPSSGGGGSSVTRYTVKFDTNGGSSVSSATVTKNAKVAEPKTPEKDGYTFGGWYTDEALTEKYDFDSKVTKNFTLYAKWDKHDDEQSSTDTHNCPSLAFDDLDITKWYHFDTDYVIENGIFKGTTETTFEPDSAQTRAMMVTVLYRVEGEPAVNRSIPFADVDMGAYYANAVIWGQQNGIIKGYSETEFGPDDKITREQIAAIMHRYAQYKGYDVSVGENTNILSYDDFDSISEYAIPSMQWAVGSGLIKGKSESTLNPLDNATRAEIAAILHRFIEANLISTQN